MEQTNEETRNKQIRFSIASYNEKDKRTINKLARNGLFSSSNYVHLHKPAIPTESFKTLFTGKSALLNKIESPNYNTLPNPLRAQYLSIQAKETNQNGGNNLAIFTDSVQKPICPPSLKSNCCLIVNANEAAVYKSIHPPKFYNSRSILPEPDLKHSGKVALTVTSYEGESKTPTRLEFLPQTRLLRTNSKTGSDASTSIDNVESISSRLQDELVATLKKSNLKNKNDAVLQENRRVDPSENKQISLDQCKEEIRLINGNVKKLTAVLDKKMTFRIKSDSNEKFNSEKM